MAGAGNPAGKATFTANGEKTLTLLPQWHDRFKADAAWAIVVDQLSRPGVAARIPS